MGGVKFIGGNRGQRFLDGAVEQGILAADSDAPGERIVGAAGHPQVGQTLPLDVVGGHGEILNQGVCLPERHIAQPVGYDPHGHDRKAALGMMAHVGLGGVAGYDGHAAAGQIIQVQLAPVGAGGDDDHWHGGVGRGEEGVTFPLGGAHDGRGDSALSAFQSGQMLVPVGRGAFAKGDAKSRFDLGDDIRSQTLKGASRGRIFDGGKVGVVKQRQLVRVLVQPGALFGGEQCERAFRRAAGPDADHG